MIANDRAMVRNQRRLARISGCLIGWLFLAGWVHALTLATYNVENYTVADRMVEGVYRQAYPKPEKEKAAVVRVVTGIAPDILCVQEMGGASYLEDFQQELRAAGQDFRHVV